MSWFREEKRTWLQRLCTNILKEGPIPKHVAIIMDGNRRYATKNSMEQVTGHKLGFEKLSQALKWCKDVGVKEVTVYAFSIENFKRSAEEVNGIMELAREKFKVLLAEKEKIKSHGLCIRALGNLAMLPDDIQQLVAEVMLYSKDNDTSFLNVCFAYTSREEISTAVRDLAEGVEHGLLKPSDVSETILEKSLYTNKSKPPELFIRTSGEVRLSDFMLWQSCYSVLAFVKVLWPEFSIWHLLFAVFFYQRMYKIPKDAEEKSQTSRVSYQQEEDYECIAEECTKSDKSLEGLDSEYVRNWTEAREERLETYTTELDRKREQNLQEMLRKRTVLGS